VSGFGFTDGGFRFPDGVEFVGSSGYDARFSVSMPLEEDGHFGRECPECGQHFRIDNGDYEVLPDDLVLWCVYCGHSDDHSEFLTQQQVQRLERVAHDYGSQLIGQMLDSTFGRIARNSRGYKFVKVTYRSTPFYPAPLPGINEENLIRERTCEGCTVKYAVFGEHRFCPVCGPLPAKTVALDALAADQTRIDVLGSLDAEVLRTLREAGVLDRTYADTIENVVGTIEALAERTFYDLVPHADSIVRGKGKVFQRLNDFADLFLDHAGLDLRADLGPIWTELQDVWAARHIFTHADGVVDQKYLDQVSRCTLRVGQRLRATEELARLAISNSTTLVHALTSPRPA
jgi:hypothetical protein